MIETTSIEYKEVIAACKTLFEKKTRDYGTAWRILRLPSITDQIFIKAQRIRSIQEKGSQKVDDPIKDEFVGIINYCLIALIQMNLEGATNLDMKFEELEPLYERAATETFELLQNKNHDYGEAWREMRVTSITDIILMKLLRVKQIEDNQGKTIVSEGVAANYQDMINYAVFALIKLKGKK
jgi:Nucleotide modification associated domain 1